MSHSDYEQKMAVAQQFRDAARRLGREVLTMGMRLPANVRMVLEATDDDFLIAQHRGVASPEVVAAKIEEMEVAIDQLALKKLGATASQYGGLPELDRPERTLQDSFDVTA